MSACGQPDTLCHDILTRIRTCALACLCLVPLFFFQQLRHCRRCIKVCVPQHLAHATLRDATLIGLAQGALHGGQSHIHRFLVLGRQIVYGIVLISVVLV